MAAKIRVLVVDDSVLIRTMISDFISEDPTLEVAGAAVDGIQGLELFKKLQPDVVTLDVEMPRMNGLETLKKMLAFRAVPIIMVSSQTKLGANITLDSLEGGAFDYVAKPDGVASFDDMKGDLLRKIRSTSGVDLQRVLKNRKERAARRKERRSANAATVFVKKTVSLDTVNHLKDKCIAIGISTGGPPALTSLFETLETPLPPIVIVQHMPPNFTKSFATRLNTLSQFEVKEAESGDVLEVNHVYVAPGGRHLAIDRKGHTGILRVLDAEPVSCHRPSADVLLQSAAKVFGKRCLGLIMTGMGRDGSDG